ncbi:peptidase dimerization domain-containing protein [Parasediminibacterium paludis]|uniref:Peptidase dimerization domain-containing protein n=1 Tax=Parasediminibacterium paludis TaxID=908966 RepID=A0ABV8Q0U5_9BACT
MRKYVSKAFCYLLFSTIFITNHILAQTQKFDSTTIANLKKQIIPLVSAKEKQVQEMVDMVFSFGELGFQETETSKYLISVLEKNGFVIEKGIAGIPTAWMARWGSGSPVIALGSDIDCIPKASQKPGVAYRDPIVEGAPGHGEGHNSGQAVIIFAAIAAKEIMLKNNISGTLVIWPGVAEELVGTKAWYIRDGYFKNVDACIFTHVSGDFSCDYGDNGGNGLVSVEFSFEGDAAHAAGAPWRGKSALDAVELMDVGWNFKREHLKPTQRSHYVITDGGDQPNVVPSKASVWYYFRERTYEDIQSMYDAGIKIAKGAAMMSDTKMNYQILGTAWPGHFNKALAKVMHANIKQVGMPEWSEADQQLARATQKLMEAPKMDQSGRPIDGLRSVIDTVKGSVPYSWGGGSDDIADISWNVPTIVLRYPANIPGLKGHHWGDAIAMATPIAHKGSLAGAKATALTLIDLFTNPTILVDAKDYFKNVQTKDVHYIPFITKNDPPAIYLNKATMDKFRPEMKKFYYDPSKYKTYLEQLGIVYPTITKKNTQ